MIKKGFLLILGNEKLEHSFDENVDYIKQRFSIFLVGGTLSKINFVEHLKRQITSKTQDFIKIGLSFVNDQCTRIAKCVYDIM